MIDYRQTVVLAESLFNTPGANTVKTANARYICMSLGPYLKSEDFETDYRILMLSAAWLNYTMLTRHEGEDSISSFKAGDITINGDDGKAVKNAEKNLELMRLQALPCLRDTSFTFGEIKYK